MGSAPILHTHQICARRFETYLERAIEALQASDTATDRAGVTGVTALSVYVPEAQWKVVRYF